MVRATRAAEAKARAEAVTETAQAAEAALGQRWRVSGSPTGTSGGCDGAGAIGVGGGDGPGGSQEELWPRGTSSCIQHGSQRHRGTQSGNRTDSSSSQYAATKAGSPKTNVLQSLSLKKHPTDGEYCVFQAGPTWYVALGS